MAVAEAKVDIPTFPADKIESELRQRLAEEAKAQAQLRGTGSGGATSRSRASKAEPEIDSLVAVEALIGVCPTFYTWSFSPGCAAHEANHDSRIPCCNAHSA